MLSLKEANKHAKAMTELHGEQWLVFQVPSTARSQNGVAARYNTGSYQTCRESERDEYEAAGALFQKDRPCGHGETTTTPDGHGAYCNDCGATVA